MKLRLIGENEEGKKEITLYEVDYTYGTEFVYSVPGTDITFKMQAHHGSTGNSFGGDCYKGEKHIGEIKSACFRELVDDEKAKEMINQIEAVKMPNGNIVLCHSDRVFGVYGTYTYDSKLNRVEEQGVLCSLEELVDKGGQVEEPGAEAVFG